MRIAFFGTSSFAVPPLVSLLTSEHVVAMVVTQPDRPQGRGLQSVASPVKQTALRMAPDISILQPEKARTREFRLEIKRLAPDVLVVAAFGQILSQRLLDSAPFGGINIHGSLLPRWRGAAPMQYALIAGDRQTGVTIIQMDAGMDTGDILLQQSIPVADSDTLGDFEHKLSHLGAALLLEALDRLEAGTCNRSPQDPSLVTYAPMLPTDFGFLDWTLPARQLSNLIRGVTPRPGAFAYFNSKRLKVWRASVTTGLAQEPGTVIGVQNTDPEGIIVQTGANGALLLQEVQPESKSKMGASEWARGARVSPGARFDLIIRRQPESSMAPQGQPPQPSIGT